MGALTSFFDPLFRPAGHVQQRVAEVDILPSHYKHHFLSETDPRRLQPNQVEAAYVSQVQMLINFRARNMWRGITEAMVKRRTSQSELEIVEDRHPWLELLRNPCEHEPASTTWSWVFQMIDMWGSADFIVWNQQLLGRTYPATLIPIYPEFARVWPKYNGAIELEGWMMMTMDGKTSRLGPADVIRIKRGYPGDPHKCSSLIRAAAYEIDALTAQNVYQRDDARKQGLPRVMLEAAREVSPTDARQAAKNFKKQYASGDPVPVSTAGLTVKPITINSRDMEFVAQARLTREQLYDIFEVPKEVFSGEAYASGRNGARLVFLENVAEPGVHDVANQVSQEFSRIFEVRERGALCVVPKSMVPEDRERSLKLDRMRLETGTPLNKILEERGEDPVEGGDQSFLPIGLSPIGAEDDFF